MNILPKKRWHVRTKDNIARVRRDEALAAEEEKKKQMRLEKAEREARTEALRKKAREQYGTHTVNESSTQPAQADLNSLSSQHVNLFYELEQNEIVSNKTNEEHEREKKEEKEEYEKKIGYLTYLGQDTNEITGKVSWYNKPREEILQEKEEVSKKQKTFEDPLEGIRKYLNCDGIKKIRESVKEERKEIVKKRSNSESSGRHKKHKKEKKAKHKKKKKRRRKSSSSESEEIQRKKPKCDLERLRAERLRREREERKRADELFARLNGFTVKKEEDVVPEVSQKYNSQFNPHLAKQNNNN